MVAPAQLPITVIVPNDYQVPAAVIELLAAWMLEVADELLAAERAALDGRKEAA